MVLRIKAQGAKKKGWVGKSLICINHELALRTFTNVTEYFSVMLGGEVQYGHNTLWTPYIKMNWKPYALIHLSKDRSVIRRKGVCFKNLGILNFLVAWIEHELFRDTEKCRDVYGKKQNLKVVLYQLSDNMKHLEIEILTNTITSFWKFFPDKW